MNCAELKELAAGYALDALEPADRAAVEAHLREPIAHEGCADAIARAQAVVGRLDRLPTTPPPDEVWRRVDEEIARAPAAVAEPPHGGDARTSSRWRAAAAAGWLLAAAAGVALFAAVREGRRAGEQLRTASAHDRQALSSQLTATTAASAACRAELEELRRSARLERAAVALLDEADTRTVSLKPQPGKNARATALINARDGRAIVISTTVNVPAGKDLQMWVIRGKQAPVSAGLLRATASGTLVGEIDPGLLKPGLPDAIAVSLEVSGGAATPTDVLMVAPVRGS